MMFPPTKDPFNAGLFLPVGKQFSERGSTQLQGHAWFILAKSKSNYLGESCWLVDTEESLLLFTLGITSEGDNHYSVNGLLSERDPDEEFVPDGPINGNMEIIGDERFMSLTSSTVDGFPPDESLFITSVFHLQLDNATLDGSVNAIITIYNRTNEVFEPTEAGSAEIQFLPDCIVP